MLMLFFLALPLFVFGAGRDWTPEHVFDSENVTYQYTSGQGNFRIQANDSSCFGFYCDVFFIVQNTHKSQVKTWQPQLYSLFEGQDLYFEKKLLLYTLQKVNRTGFVEVFNLTSNRLENKSFVTYYNESYYSVVWEKVSGKVNLFDVRYGKRFSADSLDIAPGERKRFWLRFYNKFNNKRVKYDIDFLDPLINNSFYSGGSPGNSFVSDMSLPSSNARIQAGIISRYNDSAGVGGNSYNGFLNKILFIHEFEKNTNRVDTKSPSRYNASVFNSSNMRNGTGKVGGALNFPSGTLNGYTMSQKAVTDCMFGATQNCSLTFWYYIPDTTGGGMIGGWTAANNARKWDVYVNNGAGTLSVYGCDGWKDAPGESNKGWSLIGLTWNTNGSYQIYVNATKVGERKATCSGGNFPLGIHEQAYVGYGSVPNMTIDQVVLHNGTILSNQNMSTIWNSGNGINFTAVLAGVPKNVNASFRSKELNSTRFIRNVSFTTNWTRGKKGINITCNGWAGSWSGKVNDSNFRCIKPGKSFSYQGNVSTKSNLSEVNATFIFNKNQTITIISNSNNTGTGIVRIGSRSNLSFTVVDSDLDGMNVTVRATSVLSNISSSPFNMSKNVVSGSKILVNITNVSNGTTWYWHVYSKDSFNGSMISANQSVSFRTISLFRNQEYLQASLVGNVTSNGLKYVNLSRNFAISYNGTDRGNWTLRTLAFRNAVNLTMDGVTTNSSGRLKYQGGSGLVNYTFVNLSNVCDYGTLSFLLPLNVSNRSISCSGSASGGRCNVSLNIKHNYTFNMQNINLYFNSSELPHWNNRISVFVDYDFLSKVYNETMNGAESSCDGQYKPICSFPGGQCAGSPPVNSSASSNFSGDLNGDDFTINPHFVLSDAKGVSVSGLRVGGGYDFKIVYDWSASAGVETTLTNQGGGGGGGASSFGANQLVTVGNFSVYPRNVDLPFFKFPLGKSVAGVSLFANQVPKSCSVVEGELEVLSCDVLENGVVTVSAKFTENVFSDKVDGRVSLISQGNDQVFIPVTFRLWNFGVVYETEDLGLNIPLLTSNSDDGVMNGFFIFTSLLAISMLLVLLKVIVL